METEPPIRILIVDDHAIVRKGLVALLDVNPGLEVIGEAADGEKAVQMARTLNPDVILLDLYMPNKDGITALREIRQENSEMKVLILTSSAETDKMKAAMDAGVNGFQIKDTMPEELLMSIKAVHQGNFIAHPDFRRRMRHGFDDNEGKPSRDLTDREVEVLEKMALGKTNRQIGEIFSISDRTVSTHVTHILEKMEVDNRMQAVLKALNEGLISQEDEE